MQCICMYVLLHEVCHSVKNLPAQWTTSPPSNNIMHQQSLCARAPHYNINSIHNLLKLAPLKKNFAFYILISTDCPNYLTACPAICIIRKIIIISKNHAPIKLQVLAAPRPHFLKFGPPGKEFHLGAVIV